MYVKKTRNRKGISTEVYESYARYISYCSSLSNAKFTEVGFLQ